MSERNIPAKPPRRRRSTRPESTAIDPGPSLANELAPTAGVPAADAVARRAYEIYTEEGRQDGHDVEHWLRAEQEILRRV